LPEPPVARSNRGLVLEPRTDGAVCRDAARESGRLVVPEPPVAGPDSAADGIERGGRAMKATGVRVLLGAVGDRLRGDGPGPMRALLAATITGTATAAVTYRALRAGAKDS